MHGVVIYINSAFVINFKKCAFFKQIIKYKYNKKEYNKKENK